MSFQVSARENVRVQASFEEVPRPRALSNVSNIEDLAQSRLDKSRLESTHSIEAVLIKRTPLLCHDTPKLASLSELSELNAEQQQILKKAFKKQPFALGQSLLTFFRIDLYQRLSSLKLTKGQAAPLLHDLFVNLGNIQERNERDLCIKYGYPENDFTDQIFSTSLSTQKALIEFQKNLRSKLNQHKIQDGYPDKLIIEKNINKILDILVKIIDFDATVPPLESLLKKTVLEFQETEDIELSAKNDKAILDYLSVYANAFSGLFKNIQVDQNQFPRPFEKLALLFPQIQQPGLLSHAKATAVKKEIAKQWRILIELRKKEEIGDSTIMPQAVEFQLLGIISMNNALHVLSEFMGVFDCQVVQPTFPDFLPISLRMQRLLINLDCCSEASSLGTLGSNQLTQTFQNFLTSSMTSLEEHYKPAFDDIYQAIMPGIVRAEEQRRFSNLAKANYSTCAAFVRYCSNELIVNCESTLQRIKSKSANFSLMLKNFFQEHIEDASLVHSQEDRDAIIDEIQTMYWENTLFLRRTMMILEDILIISRGGGALRDPQYNVWESLNGIKPDVLHELLWPTPLAENQMEAPIAEEISVENWDESFVSALIDEEPSATAKIESASLAVFAPPEEEEKGPRRQVERLQKAQATKTKPNGFVSPELLKMVKFRQIVKMLGNSGFTRARVKGSHVVMVDQFGRNAIVPRHPELKRGTVYGIYAQATAPIKR